MKRDIITEKIKKIEEYIPNTEKYSIRLDANESPFLPSEEIMSEFHAALDKDYTHPREGTETYKQFRCKRRSLGLYSSP